MTELMDERVTEIVCVCEREREMCGESERERDKRDND